MSERRRANRLAGWDAIHAEWTKLRTTPGTGWLLLAAVALTVAVGPLATGAISCPATGCGVDATKQALTGVQLGQAVVAVLAVLTVGEEYSTGMIRTTLLAVPRRATVLAAKAVVVTGAVLAAGTAAVLGCVLAGRLILPRHGFTAAHGYPPLSLTDGATLRAAAGSVLYLGLIGLLSLGAAMAVRDSATAVGIMLGLLYLFPIIAHLVTSPHWQRHLQQAGPSTAGLSIQATIGLHNLPIAPWAGLGVLALWAAGALLIGGLLLRLRDA
jgi:ABC-2 type transport system permease protein